MAQFRHNAHRPLSTLFRMPGPQLKAQYNVLQKAQAARDLEFIRRSFLTKGT
jgi:hypothetical protein